MKKKVLVTGIDNSSIARAICQKFLKEGYDVIATYEQNYSEGSLERTTFEDSLGELKINEYKQVNMRNKESLLGLVESLKNYTFDAIVNCPAILATTNTGGLRDEFYDFDFDNFNEVISYNITAIASICIGLKDNLIEKGCIVNVTSSAAEEGAFATISYNASKAAVKNLTKSLANNFGGYNGVRVNSVAPGWIPPSGDVVDDSIVALATAMTPSTERGKPENVADAIYCIVLNPFASGTNYELDGGITSSYLMYMLESLDLRGEDTKEIIYNLASVIKQSKTKLGKK